MYEFSSLEDSRMLACHAILQESPWIPITSRTWEIFKKLLLQKKYLYGFLIDIETLK